MFYSKINSVFTQFKLLLQIVLTYPITSNEAERSFSKLKLLLAPNRSTISVIRINNLALMGIHRNRLADITTELIVEKFKGKRRKAIFNKNFANALSSNPDVESDEGSFYLLFFSLSWHSFIKHHLILWSKSYLSLYLGFLLE